jgi:Tfp pilus tip-associated adhesin PilY1
MTHMRKFLIHLAAGLVLCPECPLHAAAVFRPETRPVRQLGEYALQQHDLAAGGTSAWRPWFENGTWQGDVIEYLITADGERSTDVEIGANPPGQGKRGGCNRPASGCWSARARFAELGGDVPDGSYWSGRHIFTRVDAAAYPASTAMQTDFTWDQLSESQRERIDRSTRAAIAASADPASATATASDILDYVRGQRLHERQHATVTGSQGNLRSRYSLLGAITGTPVYIGPAQERLQNVDGFDAFAIRHASRAGRIAAGANDGLLHVFDASDGSEVYAYLPSMLLDSLGALAIRTADNRHHWFFDGALTVNSAQIGARQPAWHTLLAGSGGAGFAGVFVLDVTDPAYTTDKLLFEQSGGHWGHVFGAPAFGFIGASNADPTWYLFAGNGYQTTGDQPSALMMVNLDTRVTTEIHTGTRGGLSPAVLLSTDADDQVELAFAGDLNGDLWMFEIDQQDPARSSATRIYAGNAEQPITSAPAIARHPTEPGYLIYFGTGSLLSLADALNDGLRPGGDPANPADYTRKQAIHGLWVDTSRLASLKSGGDLPYHASDLQTQTLAQFPQVRVGANAVPVRIVPDAGTVYYRCVTGMSPCPVQHRGWKIDFPDCGERLLESPIVHAGRVLFVTSNPTGPAPACGIGSATGSNWLMSLDYLQGTDNDTIVVNLDADPLLDHGDTVQVAGSDKAPVGVHLGPGILSRPVIARLRTGIDKLFINGIQLPDAAFPDSTGSPGAGNDNVAESPGFGQEIGEIITDTLLPDNQGNATGASDDPGPTLEGDGTEAVVLPALVDTDGNGTPARVDPIETLDMESRGPDFVYGRRSWIDLPESSHDN